MNTPHSCGTNPYGIGAAVGDAPLPQKGQESNVPTSVMAAVEIRVRCFRNKAEAIHFKEFWQVLETFPPKVKWGFLRIIS